MKEAKVETTKDGKNENIVIGNPETAKVVCTAHYDTPMHSLFPNIMIPRNRAVFYLYQFAPVALVLALSLGPVFFGKRLLSTDQTGNGAGLFGVVLRTVFPDVPREKESE